MTDPHVPAERDVPKQPTSATRPTQNGPTPTGPRGATGTEPQGPVGTERKHPGVDSRGKVRTTRAGAWWTALVLVAIVSILFLIFIAQNAESVTIRYLGLDGEVSLAVALLLSAAIGALVVALPGVVRILQLRRAVSKANKQARKNA